MKTVAVCVGHSRKGDNGALNTNGVSEHQFNRKVGQLTCAVLNERGYNAILFDSYSGSGYSSAMSWVGQQCKLNKAVCAVELHFNSAGPFAEGHEWLYWGRSTNSKRLAECFNNAFSKSFPQATVRGAKPIGSSDRGSLFLRLTPCPAIILEPFFGSNKDETVFYTNNQTALAHCYADALAAYLQTV
jgi:N-acetylmuramoyl-L-alanine amidase